MLLEICFSVTLLILLISIGLSLTARELWVHVPRSLYRLALSESNSRSGRDKALTSSPPPSWSSYCHKLGRDADRGTTIRGASREPDADSESSSSEECLMSSTVAEMPGARPATSCRGEARALSKLGERSRRRPDVNWRSLSLDFLIFLNDITTFIYPLCWRCLIITFEEIKLSFLSCL